MATIGRARPGIGMVTLEEADLLTVAAAMLGCGAAEPAVNVVLGATLGAGIGATVAGGGFGADVETNPTRGCSAAGASRGSTENSRGSVVVPVASLSQAGGNPCGLRRNRPGSLVSLVARLGGDGVGDLDDPRSF
ncbi:hypothetical protein QAD02_008216 [Eretmocerus hayati]|uniref:Uncharacterized protein n=1 Tax=Eretmocerus hayati TaxID=131215 RepID=A0ACC2N685_9HYME|nr:hypothetical protein QAD02_008216 [Eretmocerus hayati]